jgi:hypothetical protein
MPRLFLVALLLLVALSQSGCAGLAAGAGMYALTQSNFFQEDVMDDAFGRD